MLVLAPMPIELKAVVGRLKLTDELDWVRSGRIRSTLVSAALLGVGPARARDVAEVLIAELRPDHVVVCGVAGGIGDGISVGDLVVPETVIDLDGGGTYRASPLGDVPLDGIVVTAADLITDHDVLRGHATEGVTAVDMETAAVAAACDEIGMPWTAFRGISDHFTDGLIDGSIVGLMDATGKPKPARVVQLLVRSPWKVRVLARLARDTNAATKAATAALALALRSDADRGVGR